MRILARKDAGENEFSTGSFGNSVVKQLRKFFVRANGRFKETGETTRAEAQASARTFISLTSWS